MTKIIYEFFSQMGINIFSHIRHAL